MLSTVAEMIRDLLIFVGVLAAATYCPDMVQCVPNGTSSVYQLYVTYRTSPHRAG